jgi:hypothetical protein
MSLKTENSRRVVKSRPVCMGLYLLLLLFQVVNLSHGQWSYFERNLQIHF